MRSIIIKLPVNLTDTQTNSRSVLSPLSSLQYYQHVNHIETEKKLTKNPNPYELVVNVIVTPLGKKNTSPGRACTFWPVSSEISNSPSRIIFISSYV